MSRKMYALLSFIGALISGYFLYQTVIRMPHVQKEIYPGAIMVLIIFTALFILFLILTKRQFKKK